jgi:mannose/fructose/N-acetylgalactosamine-specific phosphotransferase system component IIC
MLPLPGSVPHLLELAGVAALIGGAAAVERKGAFQLMVSRPLVLGPLLGWALGDAEGGLFIGLPLELIFLGGVNLGGSLPDNETLLTAALVAIAVPAGQAAATGVDASVAALATAVLLPLAWAGRRLDRATEEWNSALSELALERAAAGDASAARVNLRGLLLPFGVAAGICFAVTLLSPLLGWARLQSPPRVQLALVGAWHAVWALAAATAIRAIRDPKAPIVAALAAVTAIALGVAFQGVP